MTFRKVLTLLFYITFSFPFSLFAACVIKDDQGTSFVFNHPVKRIISLAPDVTENLFAIDAGHLIVGTIKDSDYPKEAKNIPEVGSYTGLDLERIIFLHPDLIITWGQAFAHSLVKLKKMGIPVYINDPHHLEDISHTITQFGCLTGNNKKANFIARAYSNKLNELKNHYRTPHKLRVFYQIGAYSLFTINKTSWIDESITLCGGQNLFADAKLSAPLVSWEGVIFKNPEVILSSAKGESWKKPWYAWEKVPAVFHHALYSIDADSISRASPRLLKGITQICEAIKQQKMAK